MRYAGVDYATMCAQTDPEKVEKEEQQDGGGAAGESRAFTVFL